MQSAYELVHEYNTMQANLRAATATPPELQQQLDDDYAYWLSISLEDALDDALAAGDIDSAAQIDSIIRQFYTGDLPTPPALQVPAQAVPKASDERNREWTDTSMMQTLIRKNRYTYCYKWFAIHYRPRTAVKSVAHYEVLYGDQSFGLFDGKAQAICYIDQLYQMQRIGGVGKRMCAS